MENRIALAILNWNRDVFPTLKSLEKFDGPVIICTNRKDRIDLTIDPRLVYVESSSNVAASKNLLINSANELGASYLFIIEDDVIVKDVSVFEKYIELMEKFKTGVVFYGFDRSNRILEGKPNPCIIIKLNEQGDELYANRHCCTSVFGIDLKNNKELFDPNILVMEHEEYLQRCADKKILPFNGFYFDIPRSWEYFDRQDVPTERIKTVEIAKMDRKYIDENKITLKLEVSADNLLAYVQKILG